MNALDARPPGQGTGTVLIACVEHTASVSGAAMPGLAVEVSNHGARRLYQRLGIALPETCRRQGIPFCA
jgi:hypothetical protein